MSNHLVNSSRPKKVKRAFGKRNPKFHQLYARSRLIRWLLWLGAPVYVWTWPRSVSYRAVSGFWLGAANWFRFSKNNRFHSTQYRSGLVRATWASATQVSCRKLSKLLFCFRLYEFNRYEILNPIFESQVKWVVESDGMESMEYDQSVKPISNNYDVSILEFRSLFLN